MHSVVNALKHIHLDFFIVFTKKVKKGHCTMLNYHKK